MPITWTPQPGGSATWSNQIDWIMSVGVWDDTQVWADDQNWIDSPMWTNGPDGTAAWEPQ